MTDWNDSGAAGDTGYLDRVGIDGFGMTPEAAGRFVAKGQMAHPPLGVYRDAETWARYCAARDQGKAAAA